MKQVPITLQGKEDFQKIGKTFTLIQEILAARMKSIHLTGDQIFHMNRLDMVKVVMRFTILHSLPITCVTA
jgi:hypothetical protein